LVNSCGRDVSHYKRRNWSSKPTPCSKAYGISPTDQAVKNPGAAGALNILPGFGNFYLAAGTTESEQWLYGFLNLLCWPISVIWGIPEAAIDASTINKKETVYYYTFDPRGREEFSRRKGQNPV
jgi:hypothetical protein